MAITDPGKAYYAHGTSLDSLDKILESGKIFSVNHLAKKYPDQEINAETFPHIPIKRRIKASDSARKFSDKQYSDRIFLTRDSYHPRYSEAVIVKQLKSPAKHDRKNLIPNEYTIKRPLSVRSNSQVYVPDKLIEKYRERFPGINFDGKANIPLKKTTWLDRVKAMFSKEASSDGKQITSTFIRKNLSPKGMVTGSEALEIDVPGHSDIDIFIPYQRKHDFEKAIERIQGKFPTLASAASSADKENKRVLTGKINDDEVDVVVGFGPKAIAFSDAFNQVKRDLTDQQKRIIRQRKQKLKNAWLFPEYRYKRYKKQVAKDLGLSDLYF